MVQGKKYYLAHARVTKKEIREWEIDFENRTGLELINPFFDKDSVEEEFNHLGEEKYHMISSDSKRKLVEGDKEIISRPDVEGIISIISCKSWGTAMEILHAHQSKKKVYLIILNDDHAHPWLEYHADRIFKNLKDFEKFAEEELK